MVCVGLLQVVVVVACLTSALLANCGQYMLTQRLNRALTVLGVFLLSEYEGALLCMLVRYLVRSCFSRKHSAYC